MGVEVEGLRPLDEDLLNHGQKILRVPALRVLSGGSSRDQVVRARILERQRCSSRKKGSLRGRPC